MTSVLYDNITAINSKKKFGSIVSMKDSNSFNMGLNLMWQEQILPVVCLRVINIMDVLWLLLLDMALLTYTAHRYTYVNPEETTADSVSVEEDSNSKSVSSANTETISNTEC